jgi:hypothetical protein
MRTLYPTAFVQVMKTCTDWFISGKCTHDHLNVNLNQHICLLMN